MEKTNYFLFKRSLLVFLTLLSIIGCDQGEKKSTAVSSWNSLPTQRTDYCIGGPYRYNNGTTLETGYCENQRPNNCSNFILIDQNGNTVRCL